MKHGMSRIPNRSGNHLHPDIHFYNGKELPLFKYHAMKRVEVKHTFNLRAPEKGLPVTTG
jgi:hypothetical protein